MSTVDRWLLPDGVEDVLPPEAIRLEKMRRRLLDLYGQWGYEYVIPPMAEFTDSLLTGTGHDLDLKTFKVTDQLTGRTMGIRADITPQIARIDAHSLKRRGMSRLCYSGTLLKTRADNMLASRSPIVVGAELFGNDQGADLEIVSLMVESLGVLGIASMHVELGDVGIFRELVTLTSVPDGAKDALFDLIQRKAMAQLADFVGPLALPERSTALLTALPTLYGGQEVLQRARELFEGMDAIVERVDNLESLTTALTSRYQNLDVYFDLSELRGYSYHTGIVFAAHLPSVDQAVAKGGRYDDIGRVFGRPRRAIGFDMHLRGLMNHARGDESAAVVSAPPVSGNMERLRWDTVGRLRKEGYTVVEGLVDRGACDYVLTIEGDAWQLIPATEA
ncbi:MAG: ATP phosphoribosyltransferase regulatory subunit [Proteobacteria bacterium]|nr:ATP phosphoribosyltransferase regulatory subunit [Pseudomonadota bacterium]MDA1301304.1 ATP phosphoribosyltransferase regulatory subunit [Pseudomonadota bacterium]